MDQELREKLGRAAFSEWRKEGEDLPAWEAMPDEARQYFMRIGEAVATAFVDNLHPEAKRVLLEAYAKIITG